MLRSYSGIYHSTLSHVWDAWLHWCVTWRMEWSFTWRRKMPHVPRVWHDASTSHYSFMFDRTHSRYTCRGAADWCRIRMTRVDVCCCVMWMRSWRARWLELMRHLNELWRMLIHDDSSFEYVIMHVALRGFITYASMWHYDASCARVITFTNESSHSRCTTTITNHSDSFYTCVTHVIHGTLFKTQMGYINSHVYRYMWQVTWLYVLHDSYVHNTCVPRVTRKKKSNTHYDTLQHTATHCNTLQHAATQYPPWDFNKQALLSSKDTWQPCIHACQKLWWCNASEHMHQCC